MFMNHSLPMMERLHDTGMQDRQHEIEALLLQSEVKPPSQRWLDRSACRVLSGLGGTLVNWGRNLEQYALKAYPPPENKLI
jgi:hypothetical protein